MTEAESLVRLQEVDLRLMQMRSTLDNLPQQKKLQAIDKAKRKLASQLRQVVGERKDVENELADNEKAYEENEAKIATVRAEVNDRVEGYRRIQDLEAHLTALAKRQEKLEFQRREIEARLERLMTAESNAQAVGERLDTEERATKRSYDEATTEMRAEASSLVKERKALTEGLEGDTLARYKAAQKRFGGIGVEELRSNLPSRCRVKLQQSQFSQVMRGPSITECPYCHRLLVVQEIGS